MKQLFYFLSFTVSLMLVSCNGLKKQNETTPSTTNEVKAGSFWFEDKKLISEMPTSSRPEEGGVAFMQMNADKTGVFKLGDIIETTTWSVADKVLTLNTQMGKSLQFKIFDTYLLDEHNMKWSIEK